MMRVVFIVVQVCLVVLLC